MATVETRLTAEEFGQMPDDGRRTELVRGRIVELPPTRSRHGKICNKAGRLLGNFADDHDLGHVMNNDSGVVTERGPDTVRGADVVFYSYDRMPKNSIPETYPTVAPELVIEVRSPSDRWKDINAKVAEYLHVGVLVVCVLDPELRTARLSYSGQLDRTLGPDEELTFPECLPGFRALVRSFFE
jgi:Uma2 family endonuclease